MNIYSHRTKNDLTAWAPIRLGAPNKMWGPGIDLRIPWKFFSLRPWLDHNYIQRGAPRAKRGPGVISNIRHLRFCVLQNTRGKCHSCLRILMWSPKIKKRKGLQSFTYWLVSVISMGPLKPMGPLKFIGPGVIVPLLPFSVALHTSEVACDRMQSTWYISLFELLVQD